MSLVHSIFICALVILFTAGCHIPFSRDSSRSNSTEFTSVGTPAAHIEPAPSPISVAHVQPVAYQEPDVPPPEEVLPTPGIEVVDELTVENLIDQVLMTHPSVEAMVAAWQAAADRYPQVVSLDDPMFGAM